MNGMFRILCNEECSKLEQHISAVPTICTAVEIPRTWSDLSLTVCISVGRRLYLALLR